LDGCLPKKERTIPVNSQKVTFHEMKIGCFPAHSALLSIQKNLFLLSSNMRVNASITLS
jgi:hypothetical protein